MLDAKRYFYKFRNLENRIAERARSAALEFIDSNDIDYSDLWEKLERMLKDE